MTLDGLDRNFVNDRIRACARVTLIYRTPVQSVHGTPRTKCHFLHCSHAGPPDRSRLVTKMLLRCVPSKKAAAGPPRVSAAKRGYGFRWQRASRAFLAAHPRCVDPFKAHGLRIVASTCTDHIIRIKAIRHCSGTLGTGKRCAIHAMRGRRLRKNANAYIRNSCPICPRGIARGGDRGVK